MPHTNTNTNNNNAVAISLIHPSSPNPHPHETMSTISNAPLKNVLQLQQAALYEISQLNLPRLPVMEMEVELHVPNLFVSPGYFKQDMCRLIQNNKLSKAPLYFPPKYTPDK
jgi:hypothetical protein